MIGNQLWRRITSTKSKAGEKPVSSSRRAELSKVAECLVRFALALTLSGAKIFGNMAPFAVGMTAASGTGASGIATMLGACAGYLLNGDILLALKYIAMALIISCALYAFRSTVITKGTWHLPAIASLITACTSFVYISDGGWSLSAIAFFITEVLLIGGSSYFYKIALSPWSGRFDLDESASLRHTISILILLGTLLLSFSRINIFGIISIGRMLAALIVLLSAYKGGVSMGSVSGISLGIAMDCALSATPFYTMAFGLAGVISGIFSKHGRLMFALSFILSSAAVTAWSWSISGNISVLYEVFIASVVFMILPNSAMLRIGALLPGAHTGYGIQKSREYTKSRVDLASKAFRELYETVKAAAGCERNDSDIATVFDKAAEITCRKCSQTSDCWYRNYQTTLNAMNNVAPIMLERGKLLHTDFPDYFSESCKHLPDFISAINDELRSLIYRRQYRIRLRENQTAAFNQYADISTVLDGISTQLGQDIKFDPVLEQKLQKYLSSIDVQSDTAVFRDSGGRLHAEITSGSLSTLKRDEKYLDKLSAVLGMRLCAAEAVRPSDKMKLLEAEPLAASVGIASLKKKDQPVSGDKGTYFKTDEGILFILLSDGMGTGEGAAKHSGDVIRILERFLRSGVSAETSVRILNDLMLLKNDSDIGCATVDLLCINLFTGETNMFKYGAAPSYLRSGNVIRRIKGQSLAVGLSAPPYDSPDHIKLKLAAGTQAVIISDGVTAGLDDAWLREKIASHDGNSSKELAREILKSATQRFGSDDDMTVLTVHITERE